MIGFKGSNRSLSEGKILLIDTVSQNKLNAIKGYEIWQTLRVLEATPKGLPLRQNDRSWQALS